MTIIAAIAEMEVKMITARTMAGKVAAFGQGRWIGTRFVPFGFMKVAHPTIKDAWTLAHNPETAPIAKEVARLVREENATSYGIAQWLNDHGVPTVNGKVGGWRPNTVREMFTHEVMVGRSFWQGDVLRDENGLPRTVFPPLTDVDTDTGQLYRGQIRPATRMVLRDWLGERFTGRADVDFAVEGCTGWRFIAEELARAGVGVSEVEYA